MRSKTPEENDKEEEEEGCVWNGSRKSQRRRGCEKGRGKRGEVRMWRKKRQRKKSEGERREGEKQEE